MTDTPPPPAGWYDDPKDGSRERWWNGSGWSEQVRSKGAEAMPAPSMPAATSLPSASPITPTGTATGAPAYGPRPDAPNATAAMVLGILSLVVCTLLAPIALVLGRNAMKAVDASGGTLDGRGKAQAGFILGIVGTALLVLAALLLIVALAGSATWSEL